MGQTARTSDSSSTAGAWIGGGALWVLGALVDHDTGLRFYAAESLWIIADVLLLVGLLGLMRLRLGGGGGAARAALRVAIAARLLFVAAEATLLVARDNSNAVGTALLPLAATVTAGAMLLYGVKVVRAAVWPSPERLAPLAMGAYPFVFMFPLVAATGAPNLAAIGGWGVPAMLLGFAVRSVTTRSAASSAPSTIRVEVVR